MDKKSCRPRSSSINYSGRLPVLPTNPAYPGMLHTDIGCGKTGAGKWEIRELSPVVSGCRMVSAPRRSYHKNDALRVAARLYGLHRSGCVTGDSDRTEAGAARATNISHLFPFQPCSSRLWPLLLRLRFYL